MLKKSGNEKKETKTSPWYVTLSTYHDEDYSDDEVTYSWFRRTSTTTDDLYEILEFDEDERDNQRKVTSTTRPTTMITTTRTTTPFAPNDYFFYGYNHSTLLNTRYNYYTYGPFNISTNFIVFNSSLNTLNIYSDGYVKFFVHAFSYISIDPFYSSIDRNKNPKIYLGDIKDPEMLQSIGTDIRNLCKNGSFVPTWAYVITWYNSQPVRNYYSSSFINSAYSSQNFSNTFQLLLTSNGNESYAMFNYVSMDWPNEYISSYFTSTYYYYLYGDSGYSYGQKVFESNSMRNLTDKSNMGRPGRWFLSFNNSKCLFE